MSDENYKNLSEDEMTSEVVSRLSGQQGRERLEEIQGKLNGETKGLFQKLIDLLDNLWKWVGENVFDIKNFGSVQELTDRVLYDLISDTNFDIQSSSQPQLMA